MPRLRKSRPACWIAGSFLLLAASMYAIHTVSVFTNPANSGESGILLLPFALPWILLLPESTFQSPIWDHALLPGWWLLVLGNTGILHTAFGGLR